MAAGDVDVVINSTNGKGCNFFDGVDDYVEIPHSGQQLGTGLLNGFTISAWIWMKTTGEGTAGRILDKSTAGSAGQSGFYFITTATNRIQFVINNGTAKNSGNSTITPRVWTHVMVTVSSAQLVNFYINGVLTGTANQDVIQPITAITSTSAMRIGNRSGATDRTFDGYIRQVKMWNKVLSAAEIALDYAGTNVTDGLIHWFKLNGDYADYGNVGVAATASGSTASIIDDTVATAIHNQWSAATNTFLICEVPEWKSQICTVNIKQA